MSILKLDHVNYIYEAGTAFEHHALTDITVEFGADEFVGIIGHTGSGKSTLIQMCNGLEKPTSGTVLFHGEDIHQKGYDLKSLRCKVGLVFQYPEHQLFAETVRQDAAFGPMNQGLSREEALERASAALALTRLPEELYDCSPFELSGGQKRRAAIAGVLAMEPEILMLDEPTAGLDPKGRDEILDLIAGLRRERSMTVLLVSHSMEDVAKYADRLLVMDDGKLRYHDTTEAVFAHYKELEEMGLRAPALSYVLHSLKEKGWPVGTYASSPEEARDMILGALGK